MKDIDLEEKLLGMWLSCMTIHEELLSAVWNAQSLEDNLTGHFGICINRRFVANFLAFVKAYIGVACMLAVYASSNSLLNDHLRERTFGVLKL